MTGQGAARRRFLLALCSLLCFVAACGGPASRLIQLRARGPRDAVALALKNATSVPINALYFAKTTRVTAAGQNLQFDSPEGRELWGPDLLTHSAVGSGDSVDLDVPGPGLWDAWVSDRDGRYQHVTGLRLALGRRYILELNEGGWRLK